MRATSIHAAGDIRVTDAPDPEIVEPTDALVQVTPRLRVRQRPLVKIPDLDPATAGDGLLASLLTLSDVYGTGWHAAHRAGVTAGDTVAVIGDGAVGLLAVLSATRLGAERIVLMGRHRSRTDLGREFAAMDAREALKVMIKP